MVPKKGEFSSFPNKFDDILFGGESIVKVSFCSRQHRFFGV